MPWRDERPKVWLVFERRGDGYHTWEPEYLAVYFDEMLAREHADRNPAYDYESVPLAPQVVEVSGDER